MFKPIKNSLIGNIFVWYVQKSTTQQMTEWGADQKQIIQLGCTVKGCTFFIVLLHTFEFPDKVHFSSLLVPIKVSWNRHVYKLTPWLAVFVHKSDDHLTFDFRANSNVICDVMTQADISKTYQWYYIYKSFGNSSQQKLCCHVNECICEWNSSENDVMSLGYINSK